MKKIRILAVLFALAMPIALFSGCSEKTRLNPKKPVTISIWHYYNGAIANAFDTLLKEFNETVGLEQGIIVEGFGMGNVTDLEKAVMSSADKDDMPNIFASYADTAYEAEKMNLLANLDDYFTETEQKEYLESYIEEGRIGKNGELRIFPIAKATEVMMVNETDWLVFAEANGLSYNNLRTMEGLVNTAEVYYRWTDSLTPEPEDGKPFFGRDSMANLFIIGSKQFETEIFSVANGSVAVNINRDAMRRIWDNYYIPYVNGYFYSYGKFRSDDAKVGDILAYVGSTSSAAYFPNEVTVGGSTYPVKAKALPAPYFEDGKNVIVQQGAGMVVTKSTPEKEYASVVFLKWVTEARNNIEFSALSGYMPVKKQAMDFEMFVSTLNESGYQINSLTRETLEVALTEASSCELYTNKAFAGGTEARGVLEHHLQNKAAADREAVLEKINSGTSRQDAVAQVSGGFEVWLEELTESLNSIS